MPTRGNEPSAVGSSGERGFSLPEILVGLAIAVVIAGGAMAMVSFASQTQPEATERASQLQQGRTLIEQLTRELRQGESVEGASASGLEIVTHVNSATCGGAFSATTATCRVFYACTSTACTRTEKNPDGTGGGTARTVISGITGPNVFTYSPTATEPSYVGVQFSFPSSSATDGEAVTLSDGVALRNWFADG